MHSISPLPAIALLGLLVVGCGPDFDPPSYLQGLRVLALIADPVEAGPADRVTITPVTYLAEGETLVSRQWSFCPFSLGPTAGYQCAVPACEVGLTPDENGVVDTAPGALALACLEQLASGEVPAGIPEEIPEKVDVYFNYRVISSLGVEREAVLKLALWTLGPPAEANQSPQFSLVSVDGAELRPGELAGPVAEDQKVEIRAQVVPASLDSFTDQAGQLQTEEAIFSFYATAGRFEYDRVQGPDARVNWRAKKLEPGQTQAEIYVTVRDLRGGQAVYGPVSIPIIR